MQAMHDHAAPARTSWVVRSVQDGLRPACLCVQAAYVGVLAMTRWLSSACGARSRGPEDSRPSGRADHRCDRPQGSSSRCICCRPACGLRSGIRRGRGCGGAEWGASLLAVAPVCCCSSRPSAVPLPPLMARASRPCCLGTWLELRGLDSRYCRSSPTIRLRATRGLVGSCARPHGSPTA